VTPGNSCLARDLSRNDEPSCGFPPRGVVDDSIYVPEKTSESGHHRRATVSLNTNEEGEKGEVTSVERNKSILGVLRGYRKKKGGGGERG
jgi:hypothetical protein